MPRRFAYAFTEQLALFLYFRLLPRLLSYLLSLFAFLLSPDSFKSAGTSLYLFFPLIFTNFLTLFHSFVHFHHWHIGAYADFSLFFGAQLTFCLTVRLLFIELKRERQKNGNKSKCAEQIMNTSKYECNSDEWWDDTEWISVKHWVFGWAKGCVHWF